MCYGDYVKEANVFEDDQEQRGLGGMAKE